MNGSDVRYTVESSFSRLSGIPGWKYPNQYESWIGYESKIGWLIPIQRFCTRPRFYPPPRADAPSEGSRSPSLLSGYHMSHANTCHMLSDITFVCGERLDDTPKTIPQKIFVGHFCLKVTTFKSCEADSHSPQHRCLASAAQMVNIYRELIEAAKPIWLRSNLRLAGELKFALL